MTLTPTTTTSKSTTSAPSPKIAQPSEIKEYSFVSEGLAPCSAFALLGYYVCIRYGEFVSNADLLFSIGFVAYVIVANVITFDSNKLQFSKFRQQRIEFEPMGKHSLGRGQFITEKSFLVYFGVSKILGFLIPLIMIFTGPSEIATMVTPSLVLVIAQAVAEPSTAGCHDVLRMAIPIGYSAYRLFGPLQTWVVESHGLYLEHDTSTKGDNMIYAFNLGLAWINLVFAVYNLFVFLILRTMPLYFDKDETPCVEFEYTLLPIPKKGKNKAA